MAYNEQDPLLPKDRPAPEIQGSRAQSVNDVVDREALPLDINYNTGRRRRFGDVLALFIGMTALLFLVSMISPDGWKSIWGDNPWAARTVDERVNSILTRTPLIGVNAFTLTNSGVTNRNKDGHNDLAILIRFLYNNHIYEENFTQPFTEGGMYAQVDLPRLKQGKVGGAFWSAFVPCPKDGDNFSDENYVPSERIFPCSSTPPVYFVLL
jgi:membrane dipeptidase